MTLDAEQIENWNSGVGLVGLAGLDGSGKTTAAQTLIDAGWHRVKFAAPIKEMIRVIGMTDRHIEGDLKDIPCDILGGRTPRHAMQTLGTEWGRDLVYTDLWVDIARRKITLAMAAGVNVVVDDVRFEDEASMIRDLGGVIVGIKRGAKGAGSHASEAGVKFDMVCENNASEAALRGWFSYVFLMAGYQ